MNVKSIFTGKRRIFRNLLLISEFERSAARNRFIRKEIVLPEFDGTAFFNSIYARICLFEMCFLMSR